MGVEAADLHAWLWPLWGIQGERVGARMVCIYIVPAYRVDVLATEGYDQSFIWNHGTSMRVEPAGCSY